MNNLKMTYLQPNSKIYMSFRQGNIGSSVPIDIGSCVSHLGYNSYSGLNFEFNKNSDNLPFQIPEDREKRIFVCGSIAIGIINPSSTGGFVTIEVLHDLLGPDGISQLSPQIVTRDNQGKPLETYKPKELHSFDLDNGPILAEINLNGSEALYKKIFKK